MRRQAPNDVSDDATKSWLQIRPRLTSSAFPEFVTRHRLLGDRQRQRGLIYYLQYAGLRVIPGLKESFLEDLGAPAC
ncbi:hypothetical protein cyc_02142 [Cyclospora cayetanensis]|uniref:Uncharacterized protein n=1 Tax=Cyclospora cayetanensis TaxID=88456 RepID=A0A1D3CTT0_9EIME|nr:hypothetical protein cyc_02142 [Cyclospora cayetanensis]